MPRPKVPGIDRLSVRDNLIVIKGMDINKHNQLTRADAPSIQTAFAAGQNVYRVPDETIWQSALLGCDRALKVLWDMGLRFAIILPTRFLKKRAHSLTCF